ncbi:lysophospholipid acyltransferase family protein [Brachybacterium sacelli]|uniref:lysophospholipid acyltransferase family protein n=1 Tax=Brachybacterium sacelli TaxID=173364 RepID=UPI00361D1659
MGVARVLWNPTIAGTENIPDRGAVILASNHLAYSDAVFLPGQVRRTVHFLGKSDIFAGRSPLNKVVAGVMRGLHVMPVDRSGGHAASTAIEAGLTVLRAQKVLGIYPRAPAAPTVGSTAARPRGAIPKLTLHDGPMLTTELDTVVCVNRLTTLASRINRLTPGDETRGGSRDGADAGYCRRLGISVSTVSLALNHKDKGRVKPAPG